MGGPGSGGARIGSGKKPRPLEAWLEIAVARAALREVRDRLANRRPRACVQCGNTYTTATPRVTCSPACERNRKAALAESMRTTSRRVCIGCGEPFVRKIGKRNKGLYCTRTCAANHNRPARPAPPPRPMRPLVVCPCGALVPPDPPNRLRRYCSPACVLEANRAGARAKPRSFVCRICRRAITTRGDKRRLFCSPRCNKRFVCIRKRMIAAGWPMALPIPDDYLIAREAYGRLRWFLNDPDRARRYADQRNEAKELL